MAHLTLAGVSEDGTRLLLVSDKGVEFTLPIDARLRAALSGDHARLGQLEITMESTLRPRDIQARIRSGESPAAVAEAAQTTVDRIMPYAAPVLAERQHVAERAQRSSVRRPGGESGATGAPRALGDLVAHHLRSRNVDPQTVEWDAWRREDGRWCLTAEYAVGERSGRAVFTFDAPGNYVLAEDDDARWLLGEAREPESGTAASGPAAPSRDDLSRVRERRMTAAQSEELPLGEDAIGLVHEHPEPASLGAEQSVEAYLDEEPPTREQPAVPADAEEPAGPEQPEQAAAEGADPPRRKGRKGRASVPSWDEIMFGGSSGSDRG